MAQIFQEFSSAEDNDDISLRNTRGARDRRDGIGAEDILGARDNLDESDRAGI